ncbi:MAG TPA: DUF2948 family protein [Xanthobacteraceae bacterium]
MQSLKLVALDQDDLEVISAHLQDAVLKVSDVIWRPAEKRLVVGLNRFDWEAAQWDKPEYRRRRAALRFDCVKSIKCRHVSPAKKDAVLNLLAVSFDLDDPPSGVVTLHFSGGAALRVEVECLEAQISDLGPVWEAAACPCHVEEGAPASPQQERRTVA